MDVQQSVCINSRKCSQAEMKVGAICDVYEPNLEQAISVAVKSGSQPKAYRNYKDLLADKDIQACQINKPGSDDARNAAEKLYAKSVVYAKELRVSERTSAMFNLGRLRTALDEFRSS